MARPNIRSNAETSLCVHAATIAVNFPANSSSANALGYDTSTRCPSDVKTFATRATDSLDS